MFIYGSTDELKQHMAYVVIYEKVAKDEKLTIVHYRTVYSIKVQGGTSCMNILRHSC